MACSAQGSIRVAVGKNGKTGRPSRNNVKQNFAGLEADTIVADDYQHISTVTALSL